MERREAIAAERPSKKEQEAGPGLRVEREREAMRAPSLRAAAAAEVEEGGGARRERSQYVSQQLQQSQERQR